MSDLNYIEEYEEALFRAATFEAAKFKSIELMNSAVEFSSTPECDDDLKRFEKKLSRSFRKNRAQKALKTCVRVSCRGIIVLLVIVAVSFTSIMSVKAWREEFTRFLVSVSPKFAEIQLTKQNYSIDEIMYNNYSEIGISNIPTYVPKDFTIKNITINESVIDIYYEKSPELYVSFTAYTALSHSHLDIESVDSEKEISILGNPGLIVTKDGTHTITWTNNEYYYTLISPIDSKELIKIAESIC